MRLIQNYYFHVPSKIPFSQWPQIVHQFMEEQGLSCGRFLYYFDEFPILGSPLKSCPRAVKDCPALGEPEFAEGSAYGLMDVWMLSNIHTSTACTEADLLPLMKRIHRTYGFSNADLYYLDMDFFGRVVPMERDLSDVEARAERYQLPPEPRLFLGCQPRGSGITLHRDILSNNILTLSIELPQGGTARDAEPYFEALKALLPGVRHHSHLQMILTKEELAQIDALNASAGPLLEHIRQFFEARLPGNQGQNRFLSQYKLAPILKALSKQYGWSYRFIADGVFTMDKVTQKGQFLRLMADSGPSRYDTGFYLEFQGVGYQHRLYTSVFRPTNQQELDDAAALVFAAVAEFERELLTKLADHFPAVPDWFFPTF